MYYGRGNSRKNTTHFFLLTKYATSMTYFYVGGWWCTSRRFGKNNWNIIQFGLVSGCSKLPKLHHNPFLAFEFLTIAAFKNVKFLNAFFFAHERNCVIFTQSFRSSITWLLTSSTLYSRTSIYQHFCICTFALRTFFFFFNEITLNMYSNSMYVLCTTYSNSIYVLWVR